MKSRRDRIKKDNRKRRRCKLCKQRVNLMWCVRGGKIFFICPNCHGTAQLILKK